MKEMREELSDASDDEPSFVCPITFTPVDPNWMKENKRLKLATADFLKKNPWAYQYDRQQSFRKTKIRMQLSNDAF